MPTPTYMLAVVFEIQGEPPGHWGLGARVNFFFLALISSHQVEAGCLMPKGIHDPPKPLYLTVSSLVKGTGRTKQDICGGLGLVLLVVGCPASAVEDVHMYWSDVVR